MTASAGAFGSWCRAVPPDALWTRGSSAIWVQGNPVSAVPKQQPRRPVLRPLPGMQNRRLYSELCDSGFAQPRGEVEDRLGKDTALLSPYSKGQSLIPELRVSDLSSVVET